jgi:two-component sensor histidine kinase
MSLQITQSELDQELRRLGDCRDVLSDSQARRWAMRQRGMSYAQIGMEEACGVEPVRRSVLLAEAKLRKAGIV